MVRNIAYLPGDKFEEIYYPFSKNFSEYITKYIIPDVIAFYLANGYIRKCLTINSLKRHIYSAKDVFNIKCDIDELMPSIEEILRIKYNLKIEKLDPMILKRCDEN